MFALLIWPAIFPAMYILSARALSGPDGRGLNLFNQVTGTDNFLGYIIVGTTVWMWQNIVLWDVGFALRQEQWRGTLETNWMTPTFRFSFLIGNTFSQLVVVMSFILISFLEFSLFFGLRLEGDLWLGLLVILVAIPSIYGLGFALASLIITAKEAQNFVFLVRGLVMIFCSIANHGRTVTPHALFAMVRDGRQYNVPAQFSGSPISEQTAGTLTGMLTFSLESESSLALVLGYRVAGKTGTAQIPTDVGYESLRTNASFIGWGTVDDPEFMIYVWIERPTASIWGSETAAPVFSKMAEKTVILLDIPPDSVRQQLAAK